MSPNSKIETVNYEAGNEFVGIIWKLTNRFPETDQSENIVEKIEYVIHVVLWISFLFILRNL